MQVRIQGGDQANALYLTEEEYQLLLDRFEEAIDEMYSRVKDTETIKTATRLMAEAGLRAKGIENARWGEFYSPRDDNIEITFLRIIVKDKRRDPWVRKTVRELLQEHVDRRQLKEGEPIFMISYNKLNDRLSKIGEYLAEITGNPDWVHLRPHDMRRRFANELIEAGVDPEVAMFLGGWEDEGTFWNSYVKPAPAIKVQRELARADLLEVDVDNPEAHWSDTQRIIAMLKQLQKAF